MKTTGPLAVAVVVAAALLAGCAAESATVEGNPVWSATVPGYGVEYSKTTNIFPFYSKNVTAYSDRIEETGNILLFISWSKTTVLCESDADEDIFEAEEAVEEKPAEIPSEILEEEAPQ